MRPIGGRSTVYDRMKNNGGYMTGQSHVFHALRGDTPPPPDPASPLGDEPDQPQGGGQGAAPNYREAERPNESCQDCEYLNDSQERCSKYDFSPKLYFVCDSFETRDETGDNNGKDVLDQNSEAEDAGKEMYT